MKIKGTNKEYQAFVLDQLCDLDGVTYRMMMGEFVIYHHGKIAAYLCDDRLLVMIRFLDMSYDLTRG